jgi:hypothetical protein
MKKSRDDELLKKLQANFEQRRDSSDDELML